MPATIKRICGLPFSSGACLRFGHGLVNPFLLRLVSLSLHFNVQNRVAKRLAFSSHSDILYLLICTCRGLFLHLIGKTALDEGRARRKYTGFVSGVNQMHCNFKGVSCFVPAYAN